MFNWEKFLQEHHVNYVTTGPNVARGNINIKCPFCGNSDPSEHMGLELATGYWGCWRDIAHRGKNPVNLIIEILHCSISSAKALVGETSAVDLGTFSDFVSNLKDNFYKGNGEKPFSDLKSLTLHINFRPILTSDPLAYRFLLYLKNRGFQNDELIKLVEDYQLNYCLIGKWEHRLIIPIYADGKLVTWTGRTTHPMEPIRYKSLSDEESVINIKETILNFDELKANGGKVLFITEGPFDAIKVDFYAKKYGCGATCIFGLAMSEAQIFLIFELSRKFSYVYYLPDEQSIAQSMKLVSRLTGIVSGILELPTGVHDPGDLTESQIKALIDNI